ncbi:hypothetical protein EVG20_g8642 [Dentipellis fragilis]|uniref:ERCC1-like central domain-containing protein n=1 Tax=Dentipellis fragilis TaxID=205917 RepID=A0A4Y9Y5V3_9AGAM|nr:hypothetical protein EVG20_g8642 [Dentipellis fragilis]
MSASNSRPNTAALTAGPSKKPVKPPVVQPGSGNNIIINPCQVRVPEFSISAHRVLTAECLFYPKRLNPILECIRNVGKEFGEILPDFQVGRTTGVLFLRYDLLPIMYTREGEPNRCSLRYHRLHPEYIHQRIEALGHSYNLRILLLMCDISEHQEHIRELTKICMINNLTIIVAWTPDEAGQYLATFKQFEHKPPDLIRERVERAPAALMRAALTSISKVNKTDVETLRTSFGSMAGIARATSAQLAQLPGFGPKKVARMKDAFERPFRNNATSALLSEPSAPESTSLPNTASTSTVADVATNKDSSKGKGKEKEKENSASIAGPSNIALPGSGRAESPPWDIELDLNSPTPPPPPSSQPRTQIQPTPKPQNPSRAESPIWDIELDLNSPEPEEPPPPPPSQPRKRAASPMWDMELDLEEDEIEEFDDVPGSKEQGKASKRRKT